jgi:hypothetical protein
MKLSIVTLGAMMLLFVFAPAVTAEHEEPRETVRARVQLEVGGQALQIHYRAADYTAWAEDSNGTLLSAVLAYNWGWKRFHPDSGTWSAER